jgi:hypothetical protein
MLLARTKCIFGRVNEGAYLDLKLAWFFESVIERVAGFGGTDWHYPK